MCISVILFPLCWHDFFIRANLYDGLNGTREIGSSYMQSPSYTYHTYLIYMGLGPSISSIIANSMAYCGPSCASSLVVPMGAVNKDHDITLLSLLLLLLFQVRACSGAQRARSPSIWLRVWAPLPSWVARWSAPARPACWD